MTMETGVKSNFVSFSKAAVAVKCESERKPEDRKRGRRRGKETAQTKTVCRRLSPTRGKVH